ncbi:hypothetical protein [Thiohalocapsa marina]|uniref:hypothetical protein n=1 Tax=Thiohalocapsa marina TaxID=424902 RepID=UPI0036D788F5|nr:hypothetical protein [Sphingobacteriia bacterium]
MTVEPSSAEDFLTRIDDRPEAQQLLSNLKRDLPALTALRDECHGYDGEDGIYRFYHGSFKVYWLQDLTERMVTQFKHILPERTLNHRFSQVIDQGTGKVFVKRQNMCQPEATRPIVEAFFHARYFLDMAVKYAQELDDPPCCMPSGWAALLYLYDLR